MLKFSNKDRSSVVIQHSTSQNERTGQMSRSSSGDSTGSSSNLDELALSKDNTGHSTVKMRPRTGAKSRPRSKRFSNSEKGLVKQTSVKPEALKAFITGGKYTLKHKNSNVYLLFVFGMIEIF